MNYKKIHFTSGVIISVFVVLHLYNHSCSVWGASKHIEVMNVLRPFYRNIISETILLIAILIQMYSGLHLYNKSKSRASAFFEKLHLWTGLYLAIFLVFHLSAVGVGRFFLHLDTNFYFGVAGLNHFPTNIFFIPYYALAIMAFFGHISAIHYKKMNSSIMGICPSLQSFLLLLFVLCLTIFILYGLTNHFQGENIPMEYNILIGE
jgi:uncharacterized membrane protein (DUF373 family)